MERGLDSLTTNLVVADKSRTEKAICLAVSPSLKKYGIPGRLRLFEVIQKVKRINKERLEAAPGHKFIGQSFHSDKLSDPSVALAYITASPRMSLYMKYSTQIYQVYLRYFAPEDIHVYSIDEVFIDLTGYLTNYQMGAKELISKVIQDVLKETGITATAGIGTNLYLFKTINKKYNILYILYFIVFNLLTILILLGIILLYGRGENRKKLWEHQPITDFWRVGKGYAKKLAAYQIYTMGDVARCSVGKEKEYHNEELLYKLFGINAELLIDHAWGYEPCTIADIKVYKSIGSGQVLSSAYSLEKAKIVVLEMAEQIAFDLFEQKLVSKQFVLTIGYDRDNLQGQKYSGEVAIDRYGRKIPKHAHGTINLDIPTSSLKEITTAVSSLYDRIIDKELLIRRLTLSATKVMPKEGQVYQQLDLFTDYEALKKEQEKERRLQKSILDIKKKYGKNAVLRGLSYEEGATTRTRNGQIGGHKA